MRAQSNPLEAISFSFLFSIQHLPGACDVPALVPSAEKAKISRVSSLAWTNSHPTGKKTGLYNSYGSCGDVLSHVLPQYRKPSDTDCVCAHASQTAMVPLQKGLCRWGKQAPSSSFLDLPAQHLSPVDMCVLTVRLLCRKVSSRTSSCPPLQPQLPELGTEQLLTRGLSNGWSG